MAQRAFESFTYSGQAIKFQTPFWVMDLAVRAGCWLGGRGWAWSQHAPTMLFLVKFKPCFTQGCMWHSQLLPDLCGYCQNSCVRIFPRVQSAEDFCFHAGHHPCTTILRYIVANWLISGICTKYLKPVWTFEPWSSGNFCVCGVGKSRKTIWPTGRVRSRPISLIWVLEIVMDVGTTKQTLSFRK
jgi:hypothetical protein